MDELTSVALAMVGGGRGILAADESPTTMSSRLQGVGVEPSEEARRDYRELLVTTPELDQDISGVILCDETFRQQLSDGRGFPSAVQEAGLLPGIKVDTGAKPLAGAPGETVTEGLDGLRERLQYYRQHGARFAKWRAVVRIGPDTPTPRSLRANAHALARYAALCQEADLVPIVEPEVLMDGDHDIGRCEEVTAATLAQVWDELQMQQVRLDAVVLKPNMVTPGKDCPREETVDTVARTTVSLLHQAVPTQVPGIAFLSGGQPPELATHRLAAMNAQGPQPWELTFSFGRALVDPALRAWAGDPARWSDGQQALADRTRANALARSGREPALTSPRQPTPAAR